MCTGQPYPESSKGTGLQSKIAESPFQYLNGFLQPCTTALKDWSTSLTAMTSSRHCGAITGHPMSARQYNPTYHAVSCSAAPQELMDENAAFILFARFIICSVFSLHTQCFHIMMNCLSDLVSQTTTASKHRTK